MKFFLGLDIAKDSLVAVVVDEQGHVVQHRSFCNTPLGFAQLLAWIPNPSQTLALCEPTGVYGKRLQKALAGSVGSLHEINAQTMKDMGRVMATLKERYAGKLDFGKASAAVKKVLSGG